MQMNIDIVYINRLKSGRSRDRGRRASLTS